MTGLVVSVISEFIDVLVTNEIYRCQARGNFRILQQKICVGDIVTLQINDPITKKGTIIEIKPRKNQLLRPTVSNIDQVIIVSALKEPNFSSFLLNKYLIWVEANQLPVLLVFTKADLVTTNDVNYSYITAYQNLNYHCFILSINNGNSDWEAFRNQIRNQISILSGQTGSGKSSILNFIAPHLQIKTQAISKALNRGKHTTTHNELLLLEDNIKIIDSPGFSAFNLDNLALVEIAQAFSFFKPLITKCKYRQCLHWKETPCAVKNAVATAQIPDFIYQDYIKILKQHKLMKVR